MKVESSLRLIGHSDRAKVFCGTMTGARLEGEMLACDPPWRQGNLSYWSRQAGTTQKWSEFVDSLSAHFSEREIVYLKTGVPESLEWVARLRDSGFRRIALWQTEYYAGRNAQIVARRHGSFHGLIMPDKSPDASTAVARWGASLDVQSVDDPCVGKGVMLAKFLNQGMRVVGIELVETRAREAARRLCGAVK